MYLPDLVLVLVVCLLFGACSGGKLDEVWSRQDANILVRRLLPIVHRKNTQYLHVFVRIEIVEVCDGGVEEIFWKGWLFPKKEVVWFKILERDAKMISNDSDNHYYDDV